ncbi:MAG: histidinol dehydrogenase [Lysobacteraceae bacterium]
MNIVDWTALAPGEREALLRRPASQRDPKLQRDVTDILAAVRREGDRAVRDYGRRFDGVELDAFEVPQAAILAAEFELGQELKQAIRDAAGRITAFHEATMATPSASVETAKGVRCESLTRAIDTVGLYVPGGSAPLLSTVLMLGIPAALAGGRQRVVCTPPDRQGRVDPALLFTANLCGLNRIFRVGGAQAIAAMAYGTSSIPRCDKLFGPGNAWVTAAKQQVTAEPGGPAIDMPAGPSEVLVIADDGANPAFIAADLLSQAEHGPDSQVLLLSDSGPLLRAVVVELQSQLADLPRAAIATQSLANSRLLLVPDMDTALAISNRYAPEHLILALREPRRWLPSVTAAGSVFLGDWAAEALGDYCSGTNHVLPTAGAARAWSGVSVASFQRRISVQTVSEEGLQRIGPCAATLARAEGLEAHARAVDRRLRRDACEVAA